MVSFSDNRVDIICRVPERDRLVNNGILPSVNSTKQKRAASHFKVDERPNKRPKKSYFSLKRTEIDDRGAVAIVNSVSQLGCVLQDSDALGSQGRKSPTSTLHHTSIRDKKGPSLEKIQVKPPHQRSPYATKFEDRSNEETERKEQSAQSKAWDLAKNMYKLKAKERAAFFSPAKWVLPSASAREPEDIEFVVDSRATMHMVSEKDLNSAELETMRTPRSSTTVMTANGEVRTNKATIHVKQLDLFDKVRLLHETPAVLSLGKLCE